MRIALPEQATNGVATNPWSRPNCNENRFEDLSVKRFFKDALQPPSKKPQEMR